MNKERQFFDNLQRGAAMKKEKREHVEETMEEKNARCSRDPDSNSTVCKTASIAPSQVRIRFGSIRGVVSELVKGGGAINGSRFSDRIPVFRNTLGAVSNGKTGK